MNDIAAAFGETDEQPEHETPVVLQMSREEQLTQLHQVKADALATVRPLRELTVARNGLKAVVDGRKSVVKLRTGVDKRRKALNAEAKSWIDTVNATAKEILAIIEPVEDHLKTQEVIHERQKREAEEAERAERIALRRATWPADAGEFPELEAGSMDAISWAGHTMVRIQNERRRLEQEREHAAERAELEEYRRKQAEIDRGFAERLANAAEYEYTEAEIAEFDHQARREEQQELVKKEWREKLETARHLKKLIGTSLPVEPVTEPVVLPVSEGVGRIADELREVWTPQPEERPARDAATRLADLIRSLRYLVRMQGDIDWRGQINEAILDAQS
jgi:hypothetical protein